MVQQVVLGKEIRFLPSRKRLLEERRCYKFQTIVLEALINNGEL